MTALVPTNVQLPAHLSTRLGTPSAVADSLTAGIGSASYKRISIRGGRFRIREGSNETVLPSSELRCIIVGASPNVTKSYYKGAYNPKADSEEKKPDCYSNDGIRPAADAKDPQSQTCANCEQNVWGSKITDNGSKMKACADQKRLAIISADDHSDDPEVYLFQVTPAALTDFRNYGAMLQSKGWPPELVVTRLSFDTDQAYPKIEFSFGGFINEDMVPVVDKLVGSDKVMEITGQTTPVAQIVEQPKTKASPVKVKPEAEDAEFVEVEVEKPAKGFGGTPVTSTPVPPTPPPAPPVVESSKLAADIQDILNGMKDEDDE